jgi:hypothetical protein
MHLIGIAGLKTNYILLFYKKEPDNATLSGSFIMMVIGSLLFGYGPVGVQTAIAIQRIPPWFAQIIGRGAHFG